MVTEIGQATFSNPDGYAGHLTEEQDIKLRAAWKQYFDILDRAKGNSSKEGSSASEGGPEGVVVDDPKKAEIVKDDNAKDEAKKKEEQQALHELTEQYDTDTLREAFWKFCKLDDPDTCVLRFMRARKWDVDRAVAMLAGCMKWRLDNDIEKLVERGDLGNEKNIENFLDQHRSGKVYAFGSSVEEHPVFYIHVRKHITRAQTAETMQKFIAYEMETFRLLLVPPNDKIVLFFDLDSFGLKNMDWLAVLYIVKCLEAYFPESLHTLIIYKAPWIFSGIWKILSPMLDPVVRAKIVFMNGPEECKHLIPADRLVEELGGDVKFDWSERWIEPKEGENDYEKEIEEKQKRRNHYIKCAIDYEEVTQKWAEGSSDKDILEKRRLLTKKLRVAQFESDLYWRGRGQLHRDATLDGQGKITWLYNLKGGEQIRHVIGRQHCCAVMRREIKEMEEEKMSSEEVEQKSADALNKSDWATLYGSQELAQKLEGVRVEGKTPDFPEDNSRAAEVVNMPAGSVQGPPKGDQKGVETTAADAAWGAASATASSQSTDRPFQDAPIANKKTIQKAISRGHIAMPHDQRAVPRIPSGSTSTNTSTSNDDDISTSPGAQSNGGGDLKGNLKEKTIDAPKERMSQLGVRFRGLMSKVK